MSLPYKYNGRESVTMGSNQLKITWWQSEHQLRVRSNLSKWAVRGPGARQVFNKPLEKHLFRGTQCWAGEATLQEPARMLFACIKNNESYTKAKLTIMEEPT
jgi:hypothetical protein